MSVLIFDESTKQAIAEAIKRARGNPVPWNSINKIAAFRPVGGYDEKRQQLAEEIYKKYPVQQLLIGNVRIAFNFEYQPSGLYRHISFSINKKGMVLDFIPSEVLIKEFGFSGLPPKNSYKIWTEEYDPGMFAINIIELEEEGAKFGGH